MNALHAIPSFVLGLALAAQGTATFPSDHAGIADGWLGQGSFPYSHGVSRIQMVYEAWDLNIPAGNQISRIGFRADGNTIAYGEGLNLEVRMGQTDETAATLTNTFANNWSGTPTTVFGPGLFQLPDLNNVLNPNPEGPNVWLTLPTPYTFDPSKNLLIEYRILANTNGGASFNYRLDGARFDSPITSGPIGCVHSGGGTPNLLSRPTKIGTNWINDLSDAPGNQSVLLFLNVGVPLSPAYSLSGIFSGISPQCQGQVSPISLFTIAATTSNTGNKSFIVPIPNSMSFNNFVVSSQAFCFDFFSPGALVVSNGDQIEFGIDPAMSVLWNQGNPSAATGNLYRNYGIVTLFEHF